MRTIMASSLMLTCVCLASADLVTPRPAVKEQPISAMSLRAYTEAFRADEEARVIVSGDGSTILALYVFDADGNCVAKDDVPAPESSDDLFVEWVPASAGRYSVEMRNAGFAVWRDDKTSVSTYTLGMR